eukprot:9707446-Prorocentrum_lima.AAC.1
MVCPTTGRCAGCADQRCVAAPALLLPAHTHTHAPDPRHGAGGRRNRSAGCQPWPAHPAPLKTV